MNVCVITTYKPSLKNLANIRQLLHFFDWVIIIDNNPLLIFPTHLNSPRKNFIFRSNFNIGGLSGAFNLAKDVLRSLNLDTTSTVTLLDQDTFVTRDIILALANESSRSPAGHIIGAAFSDHNQVGNVMKKKVTSCLPSSTTTLLVSDFLTSEDYDTDFPIDLADFVWCWRNAEKNGFVYFTLENILVNQTLGVGRHNLLGLNINLPSAFRHEHQMRAVRKLWGLSYVDFRIKVKFTIKAGMKLFAYPIILKDGNRRLKYMLLGLFKN